MLDRPEAARTPVGGFKFSAFVKDSQGGSLPAVPKLLKKAGIHPDKIEPWIQTIVSILTSDQLSALREPMTGIVLRTRHGLFAASFHRHQ